MSFATKIMGGSTNNKRDSAGRRLGLKKWGHSDEVYENQIILRQRGHKWQPGMHVRSGKDHTLHSKIEGSLAWSRDRYTKKLRKRVHVVPMEMPNRRFPVPPPFMFHPELQPDFAKQNMTNFEPLEIPKKTNLRKKNPAKLGASVVEASAEKRFCMPAEVGPRTLMRAPALYEFTSEGY
mmetsp:Transcript_8180/g.9872  ORF Transcript_8180/g.9872 Transcript_8180/m.9872 type:complete len:179 (-) Transcript_8180:199-735(-)